jgi:hypothetical protein
VNRTGTGVKQTANIRIANAASQRRRPSSGTCSSHTRGCRGPSTSSIATVNTTQTIQDEAKNVRISKAASAAIVTSRLRWPNTA